MNSLESHGLQLLANYIFGGKVNNNNNKPTNERMSTLFSLFAVYMVTTHQEEQMVQVVLEDLEVLEVPVAHQVLVVQEWKHQVNLDPPSVLSHQVSQVGQEVQQ